MRSKLAVRLAVAAVLILTLVVGTAAIAGKKPPSGGGGTACPDVWDPVTCANGVTYSNQCYADVAKAPKPCYPAGGGPVEAD